MTVPKLYRPAPVAAPRQAAGHAATAVLLLLATSGPALAQPSCSDRGAQAPEARCESLRFGGRDRTYRLYVPARPAARAPLLVVLHGGGGGGAGMEALTGRGFNRRADEAGAIIVYPDGVDHAWNDGRHDLKARTVRDGTDDVGYLRELVATLERRFAVDPGRVYVTGMSNGGMMTLRLACDAADVFDGFVAVAASLGEDTAAACHPAAARPLALVDGTEDPLVPYGGGEVRVLGSARGRVIGAEATFAAFRAVAGCGGEAASAPLDRIATDGTALVVRRATDCRAGVPLVLYQVDGGGHAWPGGRRYAREWLIGRVSEELDATDEIWRFFGLDSGPGGPR
ncbi:MAG: prolyl oligopeptidase family serine peptidase [Proteobacteria bacterium]|nr:prolyl oligopeptidase family serine peptidase [Pseudomonadota bacterium]